MVYLTIYFLEVCVSAFKSGVKTEKDTINQGQSLKVTEEKKGGQNKKCC